MNLNASCAFQPVDMLYVSVFLVLRENSHLSFATVNTIALVSSNFCEGTLCWPVYGSTFSRRGACFPLVGECM